MKRYAKGEERRAQLIDASARLLEHEGLSSISMHQIAEEAGIPPGSAYHFFDNASAAFAALADRFGDELIGRVVAPYPEDERPDWQSLFRHAVYRGAKLYRENPVYCSLILGPGTTPAIKYADRENDFSLGAKFANLMDGYFLLPEIEHREERFFYAIEIVDLFLSLSMMRYGEIRANMIDEACDAATAYLGRFIPTVLVPRVPPRDHTESTSCAQE